MIVLYGMITVIYIVLFVWSGRGKSGSNRRRTSPFDRIALFIYDVLRSKIEKKLTTKPSSVEKDLKILKPGMKESESVRQYYVSKISLILFLIFIGNIVAVFLCISNLAGSILTDGKYIDRNSYGEGDIEADLEAKITSGEEKTTEKFTIMIKEREYTKKEIEALAEEATKVLETQFLGENILQDEVRQNLNLVTKIEGYPFRIAWESDNYELVSSDGDIDNEKIKKQGEIVNLTAIITYEDYHKENVFTLRICPPIFSEEELLHQKIYELLEKTEADSLKEEKVTLPDVLAEDVEQRKIEWKENKKDSSISLFLLIGAGAVLIYFLLDKELHEKVLKRNRELLMDYPGLIEKLTLYMSAGMTVRNAFRKMAYDYQEEKKQGGKYRFAYEEMLLICHELDSGISEVAAYEHFGKRCILPEYMRLSNLLSQNLRKGNSGILHALRQEMIHAFEERKNMAKKLGEEAGTKLLFPMLIMLGIIMVMIMIPAYFSFSL